MAFWKRLRRKKKQGRQAPQPLTFNCDLDLSQQLKRLAKRDGKPEGELASALLKQGIAARRRTDPAEEAWAQLTPREREIVALHQLGYSRRQIAAALGIAHNTVSTHIRNVIIRLGLDTPEDLLALFAYWDFTKWQDEE